MNNTIINITGNEKVVASKRAARLKKTISTSVLSLSVMLGSMQVGFVCKANKKMVPKGSINP